jgi:hypothetical protein
VEYEVESPVGGLFVVDHRSRAPIPVGTEVSITLADQGVCVVPNA